MWQSEATGRFSFHLGYGSDIPNIERNNAHSEARKQQTGPPVTVVPTLRFPALAAALAASILTTSQACAGMEATLLVDAESGKVLHAENATMPWYPASTSKLMTVYVTLQAVKAQRIGRA